MKTPWHLWVVGLGTLLWHAGGAFDYLMATTRSESYLAMIPEENRADYLAYLEAMPIWAVSTWATGVWASVAGSLLILFRSRFAVAAFVLAVAGLILTTAYTFLVAPPSPFTTINAATLSFTGAVLLFLLGALVYARRQVALGRLR